MKLLFLSLAAIVSAAGLGFTNHTISEAPAQTPAGKAVYDQNCLACHQADGRGVPGMNPPLSKTDWVQGDKTRLINVILKGLNEAVEINGETYQNEMPAHDFLTDQQIADVLTYVRSNFGNKAGAVNAEEVKMLREKK